MEEKNDNISFEHISFCESGALFIHLIKTYFTRLVFLTNHFDLELNARLAYDLGVTHCKTN